MKLLPEVITFRITSRCNNNCKCCFGPPKNLRELNFLKLKKIFKFLHKSGAKAIVLTGGEPLLRKDFKNIIQELKKYNFKIYLDTGGYSFFYQDLILKNIDVLGLPIYFPSYNYKNAADLKTIIKILGFVKGKKDRPTIRIGTVVTKENINYLKRIGNLIKKYPIDIWKLYEFTPQNINAVKNKSVLEISAKQFDAAAKKVKMNFSRFFRVVVSKRRSRSKAYFFIGSDGFVFMPIDDGDICKEMKIGSIFELDIIKKWKKLILRKNYITNFRRTFNHN